MLLSDWTTKKIESGTNYGVESKIQQTKILVTRQSFGDLFLFGLVWQDSTNQNQYNKGRFKGRAHNSSPHKWYCHFWDRHNWYLTLLIKSKLTLVNFGTLNYWYWAQFTLTLLQVDISDIQNDWHLQLLIFGIIGISCFWFLELFIFSMSDIKHDWYRT